MSPRLRAAALALVGAATLAACPEAPLRAPGPSDPAPGSPPALIPPATALAPTVVAHTLANGLRVFLVPNRGAPLVNVQVWVETGSANENTTPPPHGADHALTGLSHFFEHLMFQGTARFPNYDAALAPLGARNNAFTHPDSTVFWVSAPREHLRHLLDIEADRFANLKLDFVHVEPEREVVKSERRQNTDASPSELAEERLLFDTFDVGPYRHGPIGRMRDVDAITLEEIQAYHRVHYVPAAMFLVIAGDFDEADTLAAVTELWSNIGTPGPAPQPVTAPAETWVGPRADHIVRQAAQTTVLWSFRAPAPGASGTSSAREFSALELIDWSLTAGKSGRLQRRLVLAADAPLSSLEASLDSTSRLPKAYEWRAELLPGADLAAVEDAITQELAAVARFGLSADELAAAAQNLRADLIRRTLSNADRGELIGFGLRTDGSTTTFRERLDRYGTITPDEIRQAAATWLIPALRARVVVVSPDRLSALVDALASASPEVSALATLARDAVTNFLARTDAEREASELEREDRALARLRQRADVALHTATPDEAAAIRRHLETSPIGFTQRSTALAKTREAHAKTQQQLETRRATLQRTFVKTVHTSAAPLARTTLAEAIALLLSDPQAPFAVSVAEPAPNPNAIALAVVEGWVLEARGLAESANARYLAAQEAATRLVELDPLATLARHLAHDLTITNLPLADRPRVTVHANQPPTPARPRPEPLR